MASEEKVIHEAYTVCPPASISVQIESLACYGRRTNEETPYEVILLKVVFNF